MKTRMVPPGTETASRVPCGLQLPHDALERLSMISACRRDPCKVLAGGLNEVRRRRGLSDGFALPPRRVHTPCTAMRSTTPILFASACRTNLQQRRLEGYRPADKGTAFGVSCSARPPRLIARHDRASSAPCPRGCMTLLGQLSAAPQLPLRPPVLARHTHTPRAHSAATESELDPVTVAQL